MNKFLETILNIYRIVELRERILLTLGMLLVYRIGAQIVLPGIDPVQLSELTNRTGGGGLLGILNAFTGGAFANASVFALGIMPYISASIVVQLMGIAVPYLQKLLIEGESGRKKITQITRWLTILICVIQAPAYLFGLSALGVPDSAFVADGKYWPMYGTNDDGSEAPRLLAFVFLANAYASKANTFLDSLRSLGMEVIDAGNTGLHYVQFWGGTEEEPKPDADIRNYGKAQLFISTPDKFGPMGLFGNITANIIYRMSTGNPFEYSPIGGASEWRNGPLTTRTDMSFEKVVLQKNNTKATFYIQISNLFNQRDVRGDGDFSSIYGPGEFIRWGMESPRPDNKQFQDYGDFYANTRYHGSPREIQVGIRTSF